MLVGKFQSKLKSLHDNTSTGAGFRGKLAPGQVEQLCEALRVNRSMKSLFLTGLQVHRDGLGKICEALQHHPAIERFNITRTVITSPEKSLGVLLKNNKTLQKLSLVYCQIEKDDLSKIFDILAESQLRKISIKNHDAPQSTVIDGAIKLIAKNQFTLLDLPIRKLSGADGVRLAEALGQNNTIQHLEFDQDFAVIERGALAPMLTALKKSAVITELTLGLIAQEDIPTVFKFLLANNFLFRINIRNQLSTKQLKDLADVMKTNSRLISFCYDDDFDYITKGIEALEAWAKQRRAVEQKTGENYSSQRKRVTPEPTTGNKTETPPNKFLRR